MCIEYFDFKKYIKYKVEIVTRYILPVLLMLIKLQIQAPYSYQSCQGVKFMCKYFKSYVRCNKEGKNYSQTI